MSRQNLGVKRCEGVRKKVIACHSLPVGSAANAGAVNQMAGRKSKEQGANTIFRQLIVVLGDQLSQSLASLQTADPKRDVVLMAEVAAETTYVRHHKKKIAFVLSAMRHFADDLRKVGWKVDYVRLDEPENSGGFTGEVCRALKRFGDIDRILVAEPGEWRVLQEIEAWQDDLGVPVDLHQDTRFICSRVEFERWADGRKLLRMEDFYREMRRRTGLLMENDGSPAGGKWNFDSQNRKPAKQSLFIPRLPRFNPDEVTEDVLKLVQERFGNHFGELSPFAFAVTAEQAEQLFAAFVDEALPQFGDYQDAMLTGEPFLFHSLVSFYMNVGLLDPLDVCHRVEAAYRNGRVPLNAAEGFIRQVIGWREYVRGIYWLKMPTYAGLNFFENKRRLPEFYWTAETDMACVRTVVEQTREHSYAHHIQRLMVTGNFALVAGIDPAQVHEWYLSVYADAYEWVELPNTLGMSQFADGGLLGSKPYAASANYINKMSDYCAGCFYDAKSRSGDKACPFNYLYWDFLARNEDKLSGNHRMKMVYATWRKMAEADKRAVRAKAKAFLDEVAPEP